MSDWKIRAAVPEDEGCLVSMWLKGFAHAREVREAGFEGANIDGSSAEIRFWKVHQPIVEALVRACDVSVLCDPERATYEPGRPAVIWGWCCTTADTVHWVAIKRSAAKAGLGEDIARALLGERFDGQQRTTFELVDLAKLKLVPAGWSLDRPWLRSLRSLSAGILRHDPLYAAVAEHVLDGQRAEWQPGRAA